MPMNPDGTEPCPVCQKPNNPGACETCEHYFGMYSDGDVIGQTASTFFRTLGPAC